MSFRFMLFSVVIFLGHLSARADGGSGPHWRMGRFEVDEQSTLTFERTPRHVGYSSNDVVTLSITPYNEFLAHASNDCTPARAKGDIGGIEYDRYSVISFGNILRGIALCADSPDFGAKMYGYDAFAIQCSRDTAWALQTDIMSAYRFDAHTPCNYAKVMSMFKVEQSLPETFVTLRFDYLAPLGIHGVSCRVSKKVFGIFQDLDSRADAVCFVDLR